ncbi:MAG: hypothetical protein JNK26_01495 [Candidatus Doudnabacteria bacterium]|nr:hypothetical protein [Candidatus Doudnabacteria bacterium]
MPEAKAPPPPQPAGTNAAVNVPKESDRPWRPKQKREANDFGAILRLFVVPIVAVTVFIGILFALILPGVGEIFAKFDSLDNIRQNTESLNQTITQLQALSTRRTEVENDLELVNNIAPVGVTEVVVFQKKIANLAALNGLTLVKSQTDEQILAIENDNPVLGINEIPSQLSINGTLPNIKRFIEQIKDLEDFVIIGEMQIRVVDEVSPDRLTDTSLTWNLDITLVKYQFQQPNEQNKLAEAYAAVPVTVKIEQSILDFIRNKFSTVNEEGLLDN